MSKAPDLNKKARRDIDTIPPVPAVTRLDLLHSAHGFLTEKGLPIDADTVVLIAEFLDPGPTEG